MKWPLRDNMVGSHQYPVYPANTRAVTEARHECECEGFICRLGRRTSNSGSWVSLLNMLVEQVKSELDLRPDEACRARQAAC